MQRPFTIPVVTEGCSTGITPGVQLGLVRHWVKQGRLIDEVTFMERDAFAQARRLLAY